VKRRNLIKAVSAGLIIPTPALSEALWPSSLIHDTEPKSTLLGGSDSHVRDSLYTPAAAVVEKIPDVVFNRGRKKLLTQTTQRLRRLQRYVGYGNFNLISYDRAMYYARNYSSIGAFTRDEKKFLDEVFFSDAHRYGFFGAKVTSKINARIKVRDTLKVPRSGHYVYQGAPLAMYKQIRRDIGKKLVLTSGIRGVVKQMYLFLNKTLSTGGNLSVASRSLAPPGHSYHGIGDFDVGKIGLGRNNFTSQFANTDEFKRLIELGYVAIRYPDGNPYGVRYEPWHIKVV